MPVIGFGEPLKKPGNRFSSDPKIRAREMVEAGILGQSQPGAGRPRKVSPEIQRQKHPRPAAAAIVRAAAENSDKIAQVFVDVLNDANATDTQKVRAMKALVGIEQREAVLHLEEAKTGDHPELPMPEDRAEAVAQLAARLATNPLLTQRLLGALTAAASPTAVPPENP